MPSTWEYHLEPADALSEARLNELGQEGWELISIEAGSARAIFKRPGPDYRERITLAQLQQVEAQMQGEPDEA